MSRPQDAALYAEAKSAADAKFLAKTSAYKSAWIVREYKKRGGTYAEDPSRKKTKRRAQKEGAAEGGLTRWFREKWVDLNRPGRPCGRAEASNGGPYPLCRPTVRVTELTPRLAGDLQADEVRRANARKQRVRERGRVAFGEKKAKAKGSPPRRSSRNRRNTKKM